MDEKLKEAIKAVKELTIAYLIEDKFCNAKTVGRALEILVNLNQPTPPNPQEGQSGTISY